MAYDPRKSSSTKYGTPDYVAPTAEEIKAKAIHAIKSQPYFKDKP